jgi:hypothetical protein
VVGVGSLLSFPVAASVGRDCTVSPVSVSPVPVPAIGLSATPAFGATSGLFWMTSDGPVPSIG